MARSPKNYHKIELSKSHRKEESLDMNSDIFNNEEEKEVEKVSYSSVEDDMRQYTLKEFHSKA